MPQALRARGAAVDLAAVAKGGSEEALDWAAAELEAEQEQHDGGLGGVLVSVSRMRKGGNRTGMYGRRWLPPRNYTEFGPFL